MWSFDRTAPAPTIEFAHRQKPQARGFTPAPVAADPRYLDVFVPLDVRKTLPVETEPRANFYVSDTWTSQTVVSVYALQSQKPLGTGQPLSEIAYACGFRDYTHFARKFRRQFGHAPGAYSEGHDPASNKAVRTRPAESAP